MSILKTPTPAYSGSGQPEPDAKTDAGISGFLASLWTTPTPTYQTAVTGTNQKRSKSKAQDK